MTPREWDSLLLGVHIDHEQVRRSRDRVENSFSSMMPLGPTLIGKWRARDEALVTAVCHLQIVS